jgi:hypothetical protein
VAHPPAGRGGAVIGITVADGRITEIDLILDPAKLPALQQRRRAPHRAGQHGSIGSPPRPSTFIESQPSSDSAKRGSRAPPGYLR